MNSGTINTSKWSGSGVERYATFNWSISQSIDDNTSTLAWNVILNGTGSGYVVTGEQRITIDGTEVYYNPTSKRKNSYVGDVLSSGSITIYHDADGTKSIPVSIEIGIYKWAINCTGNDTIELDTIPRATTPVVAEEQIDFGSTVSISLNAASETFTHVITYDFGSLSDQTDGISADSFTPPISLANQIPNSDVGICTIICKTYQNNVLIGQKSTQITLHLPEDIVPSVSIKSPSMMSWFWQNQSEISVKISALSEYGAEIASCISTFDSITYSGLTFKTAPATEFGTMPLTVTVTDTRNRSTTIIQNVTVIEWKPVSISEANVVRVDDDGTESDDGTHFKLTFTDVFYNYGTFNTATEKVSYKRSDESEYTQYLTISPASPGTQSILATDITIDPDYTYLVKIEISDKYSTGAYELEVPTSFTLMDFRNTGKGIAFGKASEKDFFECALPTQFLSNVEINGLDIAATIASMLSRIEALENK